MPTSTMNFSDPATKQLFTNMIERIYGGKSQQTDDILNGMFSNSSYQSPLANNNQSFLNDYWKNAATNGDPNMAMYRQQATAGVNNSMNKAQTGIDQKLAQNGMYGSGLGVNASIGLEGQRANALGNANTQLSAQDSAYRGQALSSLLGLDQMYGNQALSLNSQNSSQLMQMLGLVANPHEQQNNSGAWGQIAGSGLTALGQAAPTILSALSDRDYKHNITEIGTAKEGFPIVEFSYKGSDKRFRGVIAQDVEKIIPEAVKDIDGVKHVDYNKISVPFEAL